MELGKKEIDENCFENIKVIVHLAGAGIAENLDTERKNHCKKQSANYPLYMNVQKHKIKLNSFISASGIGIYGAITNEKVYCEDDEAIMILLEIVANNGREQLTYF